MQVNFQPSNYSLNNQPSFGMARLSSKGRHIARGIVGALPEFVDQRVYTKSKEMRKLLKGTEKELTPQALQDFFDNGMTVFADKNAEFIHKQVLPYRNKHAIQKFLSQDHAQAVTNIEKGPAGRLTDLGRELVTQIINLFDRNINNELVSGKDGKKMLNLVQDYVEPNDLKAFASRFAAVQSDLFLRK